MPKTLLLADDSVTIQKVVGISFANEDVDLVTVDNGDDAVARARELRPDLILADVVMPGLSGYEVCHAIKSDPALSGIPVLLLTGTFETFDEVQANEVGANGHITKPFEAQALVDQVNALLGSSSVAAEPDPSEEPEPLGLTGMVTPGASPEPYDLFEDDITAPSGTADEALLDSPPTTVLMGGEPLDEALSGDSQGMVASAASDIEPDANARTSDDFAPGSDLFAPAEGAQDGTVLLDPASDGADLLSSEHDVLESGEPLGDPPLITAETDFPDDGPAAADAMLLEDGFADPVAAQTPSDVGAGQGSADLFGVSQGAGVSDVNEHSETGSGSDPFATSDTPGASNPPDSTDPLGASDPGGLTTVLAEPPPAPDAPTIFEFGGPEGAAETPTFEGAAETPTFEEVAETPAFESGPSPASESAGVTEPAAEVDLFADEVQTPAPPDLFAEESAPPAHDLFAEDSAPPSHDLFAEDSASPSPELFPGGSEPAVASGSPDAGQAPSAGMLHGDDPMDQTTLDPEAARSYDVSSSDLGASLTGRPPAPIVLPSEPNWPPDPEAEATPAAEPESERHDATPPALSPMLEQQVHDAVEKMAWDAFGDLAERIVKDAVERIEKVAWEVIPQMTETLIREEIRKLKNED